MTTINTEAFRRIEADETGFSVTCTSSDSTLEVALNADERRALANALTPGCDFSGVDWKTMFEHEIRNRVAAVALLRRERDEALRVKGEMVDRAVRAERERDAAVDRAEQAEMERERADREREEIADQFDTFRAEIVAEAVKARESAVTRADIEKAIDTGIRGTTDGDLIDPDSDLPAGECVRLAIDAVCDLLGIEAEQAADPVEKLAKELWPILHPDEAPWRESVSMSAEGTMHGAVLRKMMGTARAAARHVLGQEADQ